MSSINAKAFILLTALLTVGIPSLRAARAFSLLLFTENWMLSGFFSRKSHL